MITQVHELPEGWRLEIRPRGEMERQASISVLSPSGRSALFLSNSQLVCEAIDELAEESRAQAQSSSSP